MEGFRKWCKQSEDAAVEGHRAPCNRFGCISTYCFHWFFFPEFRLSQLPDVKTAYTSDL